MKQFLLLKIFLLTLLLTACKPNIDIKLFNDNAKSSSIFIKTNKDYDLNNFNLDIPVIRNEVKNQYPTASITCFYVKDAIGGSLPCADLNGTSITPQGVLSLDTTYIENGNYAFTLEAIYGSKKETEVFNVKVDNPNRAPILATIGNKNTPEGELLEISISATDPDGDDIAYSHSCDGGCPIGLSFSGQDLSWTPLSNQAGSYSVTFTATDDAISPLSSSETIIIQVTNVNHNPVLDAIADMTVAENSLLTFSLVATDEDVDDTLSYSCSLNCPAGMTLASNVVSWTPSFTQAGVYLVTFRATDDGIPSMSDSKIARITVTNTNRAPVLAAIGNKTVNENVNLAFTISAIDPDVGDTELHTLIHVQWPVLLG